MRKVPHLLAAILLITSLSAVACAGRGAPESPEAQRAFGTQMAQRGLWNEARFRFERASQLDPDNPRLYNNLAVSYEALGMFEQALETYRKGLDVDPDNRVLRSNYARFLDFYQAFRPFDERPDGEPPPLADEEAVEIGNADEPGAAAPPPHEKGGLLR